MAANAATATPATSLTIYRLIPAAMAVAVIASIAASLIFSLVLLVYNLTTGTGGPVTVGIAVGQTVLLTAIATMVAFLFVFAALMLIALPLTLRLLRRGMPPLARDLVLLAVAALIAVPLWFALGGSSSEGWIFPTYDFAAAIIWVGALRYMERRASVLGPGLTTARSAAVFG